MKEIREIIKKLRYSSQCFYFHPSVVVYFKKLNTMEYILLTNKAIAPVISF